MKHYFRKVIAPVLALAAILALVVAPMIIPLGGDEASTSPRPTATVTVTATPTKAPMAELFDRVYHDPGTRACAYEDGSEMLLMAVRDDPELVDIKTRMCRWDGGENSFIVIAAPLDGGGVQLLYVYASGEIRG